MALRKPYIPFRALSKGTPKEPRDPVYQLAYLIPTLKPFKGAHGLTIQGSVDALWTHVDMQGGPVVSACWNLG